MDIDSTGKITGYKTKDGADTVFPFNGGNFTLTISSGMTLYGSDGNNHNYSATKKNIN